MIKFKKTILIIAALLLILVLVSCDDNTSPTSDLFSGTPAATADMTEGKDTLPTPLPSTPDTGDITKTITPTPEPTPDLTPTLSEEPPVVYEDKFTGYTPIDFDMTYDESEDGLYYALCGKGLSIIGDLAVVSPLYGYNSRYTSYNKLVVIREERTSDISVSSWGIQCTADTLKALDAMNIALEEAFPDSPYKLLVRSGMTKSTDSVKGEFYNEHLTGRMLSLAFYDGSVTYRIDSKDMKAQRQWLTENCAKFGFIIRYPQSKEEVTGVDYSCSEFRYVGVPHAKYIYEHNLCLEEYTEKLKSYTVDKPLLIVDENQNKYMVYYQRLSENNTTAVRLESKSDFSISGDNRGGFIVTVKLASDSSTVV